MRQISKYKNISRYFFLNKISKRVFNFKKSKWNFTKFLLDKYFINQSKKKHNFFWIKKSFLLQINFKRWIKVKHFYANSCKEKKVFSILFDGSIKSRRFRSSILKTYSRFSELIQSRISHYFRVDFLLCFLLLFDSPFQARQFINNGNLILNNKKIISNIYVKKGDILQFVNFEKKELILQDRIDRSFFPFNKFFFFFIEVDYYTNTIVVVKSLKDFSQNDLKFLC